MKIAILDDYQNVVSKLACFKILAGLQVNILNYTEKDPKILAHKIKDAEIIV